MAHWIKAHLDDPDCPPMNYERQGKKRPRAPRSAKVKAVKYLKKRYAEGAGDMQPLKVACDIMDTSRRQRVQLVAAQFIWEATHGKLSPESPVTVEVNQQVLQANATEVPSGQLTPGDRARHLAGLLKSAAVLGDVCEGSPAGGLGATPGEPPPGGGGQAAGGTGGGGGAGA